MKYVSLFFLVCLVSLGATPTHAQQVTPFDIALHVEPQTPGPFETASLNLESFVVDLDRLFITWYVNQKVTLAGFGETSIQTTLGASGTQTQIEAQIRLPSGEVVVKRIVLSPATVDIVWQAIDSYVPPFYRGKALPGRESRVKIAALPDASLQQDSVYTWRRKFTALPEASGYQKQSLIAKANLLDDELVFDVSVQKRDTFRAAHNQITIPLYDPFVRIYQSNVGQPFFFHQTKNRFSLDQEENTLVAVPFFFGNHAVLDYDWSINYQPVGNQSLNPEILTLRVEDSGSSTVRIKINNPGSILQEDTEEVTVIY